MVRRKLNFTAIKKYSFDLSYNLLLTVPRIIWCKFSDITQDGPMVVIVYLLSHYLGGREKGISVSSRPALSRE